MRKFLQKFEPFLCLNAQSRWLGIIMLAFLLMSLPSQRVMANYYLYPSEENFEAITYILKAFKEYGFYVTINGGDEYVKECMESREMKKRLKKRNT